MSGLTPAVAAPTSSGTRPMGGVGAPAVRTRAELIALARAERPWEFVELAERALAGNPADDELRALTAARLGSLGLRGPALEHIGRLSAAAKQDGEVMALQAALLALPETRIAPDELRRTLEGNIAASRRAGERIDIPELGPLARRWQGEAGSLEVWRGRDGNLVARRSGRAGWLLWGDHSGSARGAGLPFLGADGSIDPSRPPKPIVVQGLLPAWLALRVHGATPAMADGYAPAILMHEPDVEALGLALTLWDLRAVIDDPRVRLFAGPTGLGAMEACLSSRLHVALPSALVGAPGSAAARGAPTVAQMIEGLVARQQAEHARLIARVDEIYRARDGAWWRARYDDAMRTGGTPLRVLLPISRYSTFVRHSAADLAAALESMGVETRILSEPDDSSRLVSVAYLREFEAWQPDLVVLINYTRAHLTPSVPANVPFVCWVQDRMQQLFDPKIGAAQGALDFLVGHLHQELFTHYGYPRERRRFWFVPASERKFHDGPVDSVLASRHDCEIAYVSHQSETPESAHARLRAAFAGQRVLLAAVDRMYERLREMSRDGSGSLAAHELDHNAFIRESVAQSGMGGAVPDLLVNTIAGNYLVPMLERLHRHVALEWAASAASRRGWRFHLYGRGWDRHPTLSRFHRGELEHDEELRALYRTARVNLHISRNTNAHQRVYECALSGGLMARRGPSPDALVSRYALMWWLRKFRRPQRLTRDQHPVFHLVEGEYPDPRWFSSPGARFTHTDAEGRRVWELVFDRHQWRWFQTAWAPIPADMIPELAFPDAAATIFESEEQLERMVERAIGDPLWRSRTIEGHRRAVLSACTCGRMAQGLLELVRDGLPVRRGPGLQGSAATGR